MEVVLREAKLVARTHWVTDHGVTFQIYTKFVHLVKFQSGKDTLTFVTGSCLSPLIGVGVIVFVKELYSYILSCHGICIPSKGNSS